VPHALLAKVAITLLCVACGAQQAKTVVVSLPDSGTEVRRVEPAAPTPEPATDPRSIAWRSDLDRGTEDARRGGRALLLWFHADWSANSEAVTREVWRHDGVRRAAQTVVAIDVDLSDVDDPASDEKLARYSLRVVPTIVIVGRQGEEVARFEGVPDPTLVVDALHESTE
jgi:thiol:disulfide interchange protein